MTATSRYAQMYEPLRQPNYRMFISGQTVSTIGTLVQFTAQSWVVFELTHSSAALGWAGLLGSIPMIFLGPFAGALADRVNRRTLLLVTQALLALLAAAFALLVQTGVIQVWHIYVIAFATGVVAALDLPALQAFAADLAGPTLIRQAVTLNAMAFQMARMVGPSLAGVLLGSFGNATAFWVNAVSFLAVILALWRVRFEGAPGATRPSHGGAGQPSATGSGGPREAVAYVLSHPAMLDLYIFSTLFTFLVFSTLTVQPAFVSETLNGDATILGLLGGASGAGSLISTLVLLPLLQGIRRTGLVIAGALTWFGVSLMAMTLVATSFADQINAIGRGLGVGDALFLVVATFGFLQGMAGPVVMTNSMGLLQQMAPGHMRARLIGLSTSISFGMQPFAGLAVGYAGEHLGAVYALRINGVLLTIAAMLMVALRASVRAPMPSTGHAGSPGIRRDARPGDGTAIAHGTGDATPIRFADAAAGPPATS